MRKNNCLVLAVLAWVGLVASGQEARAQADCHGGYVGRAAGDARRGLADRREARRKPSLQVDVFRETQQCALTGKSPVHGLAGTTATAYKFDLAGLWGPVLLRYALPNGHVHPFAEARGAVAHAFKADDSAQGINASGGTGSPRFVFGSDGFRRLKLGPTGGVGGRLARPQPEPAGALRALGNGYTARGA